MSLERLRATLADRYRIERELGQGGMATVYLAHDLKHDRDVAIKVLREDAAASMGRDRFLREIQLAAKLSHPNILPLFDSGEVNGTLYYVMPKVTGHSLRERLDRDGMLPVDEAVRIAVAVAGALDHAHRQGVIHRDIKPENIMFQDGHALVADFGIGRALAAGHARHERKGPLRTDTGRHVARHARLHEPRTGRWRRGGRPQRHLLAWLRPVRDARRRAAVHRSDGAGGDRETVRADAD